MGACRKQAVDDRPLQGQRTKVMSLRGAKRRGNLPVQLCGYMGTDVEATPYREIPTDGIAVLGMTYFLHGCADFSIFCPCGLRAVDDRPYEGIAPRKCHCEGQQARGNLPVRSYGCMGTYVEATSYQEIPTDGIAVLGMTKFPVVSTIFHFLPARFREGQDPSLHWHHFHSSPETTPKLSISHGVFSGQILLDCFPQQVML